MVLSKWLAVVSGVVVAGDSGQFSPVPRQTFDYVPYEQTNPVFISYAESFDKMVCKPLQEEYKKPVCDKPWAIEFLHNIYGTYFDSAQQILANKNKNTTIGRAVSAWFNYEGPRRVVIEPDFWYTTNEYCKRDLVWHELSHGRLDLYHVPKENKHNIMFYLIEECKTVSKSNEQVAEQIIELYRLQRYGK